MVLRCLLTISLCFAVAAPSSALDSLLDSSDFESLGQDPVFVSTLGDAEWESFETWQCFPTQSITFECALYDFTTPVPSFQAQSHEGIKTFDVHVEDQHDCNQTLEIWKSLSVTDELCVLAAEVPSTGPNGEEQTIWYLSRLKSRLGLWPTPETEDLPMPDTLEAF